MGTQRRVGEGAPSGARWTEPLNRPDNATIGLEGYRIGNGAKHISEPTQLGICKVALRLEA
jgi:hypothetical protein